MITVGEILVRPFRAGPSAVAVAEGFLEHFAELELIEIDYAIAREAARIPREHGLAHARCPSSSRARAVSNCDLLCTNDQSPRRGCRSASASACACSRTLAEKH